ncbi:MAG: hypothetical protein ACRDDP_11280 [Plesiomonas sp.]
MNKNGVANYNTQSFDGVFNSEAKLSRSFKELISVIGFDEAILFVRMYGGRFKYIPKKKTKPWIDMDDAVFNKLRDYFGGTMIEVPSKKQVENINRNNAIRCMSLDGVSKSEIADRFNLCVRQVYNILNS